MNYVDDICENSTPRMPADNFNGLVECIIGSLVLAEKLTDKEVEQLPAVYTWEQIHRALDTYSIPRGHFYDALQMSFRTRTQ